MASKSIAAIGRELKTIGERLREQRLALHLTQEEFAAAIDASDKAIGNYEAGKSTIRLDILFRMRDVGINVEYVLFGAQDVPYDPALMERVNAWANEACVDEEGQPLEPWIREQRVQRAYRWLVQSRDPMEIEARLSALTRVA